MTIIYPEATPSLGRTTYVLTDTIADPNAPSLGTDYASAINFSCFLYGSWGVTADTPKNEAPRRACDVNARKLFGPTELDAEDMLLVYDPQGDDTATANTVKAAVVPGAEKWITVRRGPLSKNTALASGDLVSLYHVQFAPADPNRTTTAGGGGGGGEDSSSEFAISVALRLVEDPFHDKALVA